MSFVQVPSLGMQEFTGPFGSQALSPGDPQERHSALVSPHHSASQSLKFLEQHPLSEVGEGVVGGLPVGGLPVGGVGGDATGGDVSTIHGAEEASGLQIIPGQHGFP